jgi:hypothetical protein
MKNGDSIYCPKKAALQGTQVNTYPALLMGRKELLEISTPSKIDGAKNMTAGVWLHLLPLDSANPELHHQAHASPQTSRRNGGKGVPQCFHPH